jgi:hypothetical protein
VWGIRREKRPENHSQGALPVEIEESHQKWIADRAEEKLKLFEEKNQ